MTTFRVRHRKSKLTRKKYMVEAVVDVAVNKIAQYCLKEKRPSCLFIRVTLKKMPWKTNK